jgi:hypothetical protein
MSYQEYIIEILQGAQVAGDVMCGTSEKGFTATQPLGSVLSKKGISHSLPKIKLTS